MSERKIRKKTMRFLKYEIKMKQLTAELSKQMEEEKRLDEEIRKQLSIIGLNLE